MDAMHRPLIQQGRSEKTPATSPILIRFRMKPIPLLWLPLCLLCCLGVAVNAADDGARALGRVKPLTADQLKTENLAQDGSAGLFIGVADFGANSGLGALRYTVDDAVALADVFVRELRVLTAANTQVALGGEPKSARARESLARLKAAGVQVTGASKNELLTALATLAERARNREGMILCSVSTHGCMENGEAFLFPADGRRRLVSETALKLSSLRGELEAAPANKKVLIVDACREARGGDTRSLGGLPPGFALALKEARGLAVLMSCGDSQLSWEDEGFEQGVFTHHLLLGLRGAAAPDAKGFIRLGAAAKYAGSATEQWVRANRNERQEPTFNVTHRADEIPLAFNAEAGEEAKKIAERKRRAKEAFRASQAQNEDTLTGRMQDELFKAINELSGDALDRLLGRVEKLADTSAASADLFASWWRNEGVKLVAKTPAQDTPAPLVTPARPEPAPVTAAPAGDLAARKRDALKLLMAAFAEDSAVITPELLGEVKSALEKAEEKPAAPLLDELAILRDNTDRNRKTFARYWREERASFGTAAKADQEAGKSAKPALGTPTVDALIDRCIEAAGGRAALDAVRTVSLSGTVEFHDQGVTAQFVKVSREPDHYVIQIQIPGLGLMRNGFDGNQGWNTGPLGLQFMTHEQVEEARFEARLKATSLKTLYRRFGEPTRRTIEGKDFWAVTAERPNGRSDTIYFDVDTGLVSRMDGMVETDEGRQPGTAVFSDFRTVNGVKQHFVQRVLVDGEPFSTFRVQQVQVNLPVNDGAFRPLGF